MGLAYLDSDTSNLMKAGLHCGRVGTVCMCLIGGEILNEKLSEVSLIA